MWLPLFKWCKPKKASTLCGISICRECKNVPHLGWGEGIKYHMEVHKNINVITTANGAKYFHICARECNTLAGIKSHNHAARI